jgi:magnesium transporter
VGEEAAIGIADRLEDLLDRGEYEAAAGAIGVLHPLDIAQAITDLPAKLRGAALLLIESKDVAAEVVEELDDDVRNKIIESLGPADAAAILGEMFSDEEADILKEIKPEAAEAILQFLDADEALEVRELISYPEHTAGGLMQKELIKVPVEFTARDTVRFLRDHAEEFAEFPVGYIYAVDAENRLRGVVTTRALILCSAGATVEDIMLDAESVPAAMPAENLARVMRKSDHLALPVVDSHDRLIGAVLQEDVQEFELEESEEEMMQMSGIVGGEEVREMPLAARAGRRLFWLAAKILLNLAPMAVISRFENLISVLPALAVIMPAVSDMGGGAGSQAIAVSIRELALERLRPRDFAEVVFKEASVGIINGIALALLFGAIIGAWQNSLIYGALAASAIALNTLLAVVAGGLLPLVLRSCRIDPAVASMPLLTTLTDCFGFYIVLILASIALG